MCLPFLQKRSIALFPENGCRHFRIGYMQPIVSVQPSSVAFCFDRKGQLLRPECGILR